VRDRIEGSLDIWRTVLDRYAAPAVSALRLWVLLLHPWRKCTTTDVSAIWQLTLKDSSSAAVL